ncbi:MAG: DinB family protein [Cyclobacteriaceae bacterium]
MNTNIGLEAWLSGPVPEIPPLLQPSAHALIQSAKEVDEFLTGFPDILLWQKPAGRASVGFHLQHLTGVLDRLLTYAEGKTLNETQMEYLKKEGLPDPELSGLEMVGAFKAKVDKALEIFRQTPEENLREARTVGRKQLPSTVLGLYFHAAEHSQRHVGQLLVTVSVVKARK